MAKKKFGISPALTRGMNETISMAESPSVKYRATIIPVARILFDATNPRQLAVNRAEVGKPLSRSDKLYAMKKQELDKIQELANSIEKSGLINPIIVYKDGEQYRLVAGERRCLATIMLAQDNIEARVFHDKPDTFDLKLIQWFENTAREDLTLLQRIENIRMLYDHYQQTFPGAKALTVTSLSELTGLSTSHASRYLSLLNGPEDVVLAVKRGDIVSLKKASYLASIKDEAIREQAILACLEGESFDNLKSVITQAKKVAKSIKDIQSTSTKSRAHKQVNLGKTADTAIVKCIIESTLTHLQMNEHLGNIGKIDWGNHHQVSGAFKYLLTILEKEHHL